MTLKPLGIFFLLPLGKQKEHPHLEVQDCCLIIYSLPLRSARMHIRYPKTFLCSIWAPEKSFNKSCVIMKSTASNTISPAFLFIIATQGLNWGFLRKFRGTLAMLMKKGHIDCFCIFLA